jgi:hypothetical protein
MDVLVGVDTFFIRDNQVKWKLTSEAFLKLKYTASVTFLNCRKVLLQTG